MDSPFIYNRPVTGRNYIGRKYDAQTLGNLIQQGENVILAEPPKTGRTSLIQQCLFNLKAASKRICEAQCSLLDIRTRSELTLRLGSALIGCSGYTQAEYAAAVKEFLDGTHLVFDPQAYGADGSILSLSWDADEDDFRAVAALPWKIAAAKGMKVVVVLEEFQNIMLADDGEQSCRILAEALSENREKYGDGASWIFSGSEVNAMNAIFSRRFFHRKAIRLKLTEPDANEVAEYVKRGFLSSGKVLDREPILAICGLLRCKLWYINHFASLCDSASRGFMTENTLKEALETLISIHEPRFRALMDGLTTFQLNLLKAILEGHTKFSSSEVIKRYSLNSSANVRRLKDALCKKELVIFDENDIPSVTDPLFEFWAKRDFFKLVK